MVGHRNVYLLDLRIKDTSLYSVQQTDFLVLLVPRLQLCVEWRSTNTTGASVFKISQSVKLKHNDRWGQGIYGLNGCGIYGYGWGIYGLNGWGIYELNGWGSYCFLEMLKNTGLQESTLSDPQHVLCYSNSTPGVVL